jgi:hypothetical protein
MQAALPPEIPGNPDGCYPAFTTAEGCNALALLGGGIGNTAIGWYSLFLAGDASFNTGVGAGALALTSGFGSDSNTAVGTAAMLLNTTGFSNTAVGTNALVFNDSGGFNSALGAFALYNNIDGFGNNAFGDSALLENIHGGANTAIGFGTLLNNDITGAGFGGANTAVGYLALVDNTDGDKNTAVGFLALQNNVTGRVNTAVGAGALSSNTNSGNVAIGSSALESNVNGNGNTVVGFLAGVDVEGSSNIYIGNQAGFGIAAESFTIRIGNPDFVNDCYIAGILGNGPFGADVQIDPVTGQLGSNASSERFKKDIDPMAKASEAIYSLKPVTFRYKNDKTNTPQFGLIAEEVARVNPALIAVDKEGKPYTVRYNQINAMLLNEFLKEHRKVQEQEATIAQLKKEVQTLVVHVKEQDSKIQRVSDRVELNQSAPQTALNE